jgi:hypothetical protein
MNYPIFNEKPWLFAACFGVVLAFSFGLFLLSRCSLRGTIAAAVVTLVWVVLLLPDFQYFFGTLHLNPDEWIIEPLYRKYYIRGYILVLMPVPFVLFGVLKRRRRFI